jgi:glycosyltransferase involved in cell wall biosynthesis
MRIVYFTIDNINDNIALSQTFPFLDRLAGLPSVERIDLFALQKTGGEDFRHLLPAGVQVGVGRNHGIWHPLTWLHLARLSAAAWVSAKPGSVLIGKNPVSLCCLSLAALRPRTRLLLDLRGVLSEEYVLQGKITRKGRMHRLLRRMEGWALRRADGILCVSEQLRRRCRGWLPDTVGKTVVIPCCVDPRLRWRDNTTVERLQKELGLDPSRDFVLVYAGSFSAWNRPDAILAAYRAFRAVEEGTKLLLLTASAAEARAIFGQEEGVIVRSVRHQDIQPYLALADLGLLLRERNSVNRVACPVKFAEYLACGVPVLVSPGVGDCSEIVRKEGVGYVFGSDLSLRWVVSEVRAQGTTLRTRCVAVAARQFDAERYLPSYQLLVTGKAG